MAKFGGTTTCTAMPSSLVQIQVVAKQFVSVVTVRLGGIPGRPRKGRSQQVFPVSAGVQMVRIATQWRSTKMIQNESVGEWTDQGTVSHGVDRVSHLIDLDLTIPVVKPCSEPQPTPCVRLGVDLRPYALGQPWIAPLGRATLQHVDSYSVGQPPGCTTTCGGILRGGYQR